MLRSLFFGSAIIVGAMILSVPGVSVSQAEVIGFWTFDEYEPGVALPNLARIADSSGNERHMRNIDPGTFVQSTTDGAPQFGGTTAIMFTGNVGGLLEFLPGFSDFTTPGSAATGTAFDIGPQSSGCPTCVGESYTFEAIVDLPLAPFGNNLAREGGVMGKGGVGTYDHWGMNMIGPRHLPTSVGGDPGPGPENATMIESVFNQWVHDPKPSDPEYGFWRSESFQRDGIAEGWHHIAITRNRQTDVTKVYVDGIQFGEDYMRTSQAVVPDETHPLANFVIGTWDSDGTTAFRGAIDMVRISNETLEPADFAIDFGADSFTWADNRSGDWAQSANWSPRVRYPGNNEDHVVFGDVLESDKTVFTDEALTINAIEFDESNKYAIAGTGSLSLENKASDATAPAILVKNGSHEFQLAVNINNSATVTSGDGTMLDFNGVLNLGANDLTIAADPSGTTMDGVVNVNNTVLGTGTLTNNGTMGTGNATSIGTAGIGGDLVSTGTLEIDITPNSTDLFIVGGDATLSGTLSVELLDGFSPTEDITVVTVGGTLDATSLTLHDPSGNFALDTSSGDVVLSLGGTSGLAGDYNLDGTVNAADYTVWQDALGSNVTPGEGADGVADGFIDELDYAVWKQHFGATLGGAGAAAVPEPTTGYLLLVATLGLIFAGRKK